MKLFGSLTELLAAKFRKNGFLEVIRPNQATTYTADRDIQLPPGDQDSILVGETNTQTLTNKTLTAPAITSPSGLTKSDVGLSNVDNTSDATKDAATATLTNKTLTAPVINSPTGIVKADVGLSNVDNTSDATKNAAVATLTNKTLTAPVQSSFEDLTEIATPASPSAGTLRFYAKTDDNVYVKNSGGTETQLATSAGSVTLTGAQTLSNKSLVDASTYIIDDGDNTKKVQFEVSAVTTGTTRTLSVQDQDGTIALQESPRLANLEKNYIHNGNFDIWQKGDTFVSAGRHADRFVLANNMSVGVLSAQRDTTVPTTAQSHFTSEFSCKLNVTTGDTVAAGDFVAMQHAIEGFDYQALHSNAVTLQFWVKCSTTGTYSVCLQNSAMDRSYVTTFAVNVADTWELKQIFITLDNTGTWLFDNGAGLIFSWVISCGSTGQTSTLNAWQASTSTTNLAANTQNATLVNTVNNYMTFAQIQLINNNLNFTSAPNVPFKRAGGDYSGELALCQRYVYRPGYNNTTSANMPFAMGQCVTNHQAWYRVDFPVTMRALPGLNTSTIPTTGATLSGLGYTGSSGSVNSIHEGSNVHISELKIVASDYNGTDSTLLQMTADADRLTAGDATILMRYDTSGWIDFNCPVI